MMRLKVSPSDSTAIQGTDRSGSLVEWTTEGQESADQYCLFPRKSCAQGFADWITKIRALEWLPWTFGSRKYIDAKINSYYEKLSEGQATWEANHREDKLNAMRACAMSIPDAAERQLLQSLINSSGTEHEALEYLHQNAERLGGQVLRLPTQQTMPDLTHEAALLNEFYARKRIYIESGWPDNFDREGFLRRQREWNRGYEDCVGSDDDEDAICTGSYALLADNAELWAYLRRTAGNDAV